MPQQAQPTRVGAYHFSANKELYEIQRGNNFDFIIDKSLNNLLAYGSETKTFPNAQEYIRLSVSSTSVPHFSQEVINVKRGNTDVKYAGVMTWGSGELSCYDFIGVETKDILMAWQAKSGNPLYQTVGQQKDYKVKIPLKNGEIIEWNSYAPQKSIDEWIKIGKVYVGSKRVPYIKSFLNDELQGQKPSNILGKEYGTTKSGSIEIRELFGSREVFSYPKPSTLIKRLIKIGTKKDSIILDFFSGSGTTADAVIRKNSEDNGMRKFILVQIPEKCDFRSEAFQLGFDNICSIAEKRIEIVGKKIKEETNADIDYGFRVYKVDSTNMKDVYYTANDLEQGNLAEFESNIKEDRTTDDLLIQVILDLGLSLDLKIEEKMIGKNKVYYIAGNSLVACFDDKIDINIVDKICECEPYKVVFKDSAFKIDNDKINLEERFKKLLPQRASDKGFINIL